MAVSSTTIGAGVMLGPDIHANRPATAIGGALYSCTTHNLIYKYVTGTGWITYATLGAGALDDSNISPVAPNDQTGTSYTFVLADRYRMVTLNNASAIALTIPPQSSVTWPNGSSLQWFQKGAGQVTVAGGSGVTVQQAHGLKTSAQWAVVSAYRYGSDLWVVTGDTTT